MFGLIVSGRPADGNPARLTETEYAFRIPPNPTFSHIVVFQLPGQELPPGAAATVHIQIPPSEEFKLLGGIGPGKESAIFKVNGVGDGSNPNGDIVVGLSIQPAAQVEQQLASINSGQTQPHEVSTAMVRVQTTASTGMTTKVLAQRIIGNAFNFLASFGSDTVPLKAFQDWWKKFERKVELDPSFLERDEQG